VSGSGLPLGECHDIENNDVDEWNQHEDREYGFKAGLLEDHPEGRENDEGDRKKEDREYEQMPGLKQVSHGGLLLVNFQPAIVALMVNSAILF
jgi:hypothetical protein